MTAARDLEPQASLGGEMKQSLAPGMTIPSARVPSAARQTVASVENLGALDAAKARRREERRPGQRDRPAFSVPRRPPDAARAPVDPGETPK